MRGAGSRSRREDGATPAARYSYQSENRARSSALSRPGVVAQKAVPRVLLLGIKILLAAGATAGPAPLEWECYSRLGALWQGRRGDKAGDTRIEVGMSMVPAGTSREAVAILPAVTEDAATFLKGSHWGYEAAKRVLDVVVALVVLIAFSWLWLLIALAIKLTSPGPVLYAGRAVGRYGREFTYYKFRTMYHNCDDSGHRKFLEAFVQGGGAVEANGRPVYKYANDPRVTPLGRILRRTSLDEVPQFINVLRGEMSIVGPRPPVPYEYALYQPRHCRRLLVKPGITGLYQVSARSQVPFEEMVRIDLEYIARRSLWLDLQIMLRTIPVMLTGRGAL